MDRTQVRQEVINLIAYVAETYYGTVVDATMQERISGVVDDDERIQEHIERLSADRGNEDE